MNYYCSAINRQTPEVSLELDTFEFWMKGFSRPENADKFYQPIYAWIEKNQERIAAGDMILKIHIDFEYINSSSLMFIIKYLKQCVDIRNGRRVEVYWYHDESDVEDTLETTNELWLVIGTPITTVCRNFSKNPGSEASR
jgi:hypothetical protein